MEVICSSETSVDFQRTTQRYIPEDCTLHNHKPYLFGSNFCRLTEDYHAFPQSPRASVGIVPRSGFDRFLPDPFQFIIHQSSYLPTLHTLDSEGAAKWAPHACPVYISALPVVSTWRKTRAAVQVGLAQSPSSEWTLRCISTLYASEQVHKFGAVEADTNSQLAAPNSVMASDDVAHIRIHAPCYSQSKQRVFP
jgi:hypothetical protein